MKIAFVGKGGSGKTTLSSTLARYLAWRGSPVLAIDADINQHLGVSLGMSSAETENIPALGSELTTIKEYLRGSNPRISDAASMVKTTPPGHGSRLLTVTHNNPLYERFVREVAGVRLMAVGPFTQEDLGVKCYHSKTGAVELILNHLIDRESEYVIVDMTAGADSFASGLFTRFDVTFLVVEPTQKSVSVYRQYTSYAQEHNVHIRVIANKVEDDEDAAFIRKHVGNDLVAGFSRSSFVRAMEKGSVRPIDELEESNKRALEAVTREIDSRTKDWDAYHAQAVLFHSKNALSWANAAAGTDVRTQVDPSFSLADIVKQL